MFAATLPLPGIGPWRKRSLIYTINRYLRDVNCLLLPVDKTVARINQYRESTFPVIPFTRVRDPEVFNTRCSLARWTERTWHVFVGVEGERA